MSTEDDTQPDGPPDSGPSKPLAGRDDPDDRTNDVFEDLLGIQDGAAHKLRTLAQPPGITPGEAIGEGPGDTIGRYKLLERIGEGGMGEVFMAEQKEPVRRRVALKVIKLGMDSKQVVARFEAERQALALMDHPHIAHVYDGGMTDSGRPYFVMELVQGVPISQYCNEAKLSTHDRLRLFMKVCQAVQHAHQKGVIHRDLKPSNVLVTTHDGRPFPKVIDFGIAKATGQQLTEKTLFTGFGQLVGTPAYMSPEQAEMTLDDVDTRSDIYSLGVLLYELLTGTTPFEDRQLRQAAFDEICRIIREEEPPKPSTRISTLGERLLTVAGHQGVEAGKLGRVVKGDLDWIVMKALEKDRGRRYDTASGFAADLQRYLDDEPVLAAAPTLGYRWGKLAKKHRGALIASGAIAAALVLGATVAILQAIRATIAEGEKTVLLTKEEAQRRLAEDRLHQLSLDKGLRLAEAGDQGGAMPWFARLFDLTQDDPVREKVANMRFDTHLRQTPTLMHMFAHGDQVEHADFAGDGQRLVTASKDGTAQVWDVSTGNAIGSALRHDGPVTFADFSPDGTTVATSGDDGTAKLWNVVGTAAFLRSLNHGSPLFSVEFSRDGSRVITAGDDGLAVCWEVSSGRRLFELDHERSLVCATFSPDDSTIMTSGRARSTQLWDAVSGDPLLDPMKHDRTLSAVFSPSGDRVAVGGSRARARIWSTATGQELIPPIEHEGMVSCVAFSPDGQQLATASTSGVVRIWDCESGQPVSEPMTHEHMAICVAYSPCGRYLISTTDGGRAKIWDLNSRNALYSFLSHEGHIDSAFFSPAGGLVLTVSYDGTAKLWSLATTSHDIPVRHDRPVRWCAMDPGGNRLVTASDDLTARVWDARSMGPLTDPLPHQGEVVQASFSRDGTRLLTASLDNRARLWDLNDERVVAELPHDREVFAAILHPDETLIATACADKAVRLWDPATGQQMGQPIEHPAQVRQLAFDPSGDYLLSAGLNGDVQVWETATQQPAGPVINHPAAVTNARFHPSGDTILTATETWSDGGVLRGTVRLWDWRAGEAHGSPMHHASTIHTAVFDPEGKRILTTSADATARIWSVAETRSLTPALGHDYRVHDGSFSPDGHLVVTASYDETARVWDAATGEAVSPPLRHHDWVSQSLFGPESQSIITVSRNRVYRWPLGIPSLNIADRRTLAPVVANRDIDASGNLATLPREELLTRLRGFRESHPDLYSMTDDKRSAWRKRQAAENEEHAQFRQARHHLDRLPRENAEVIAAIDRIETALAERARVLVAGGADGTLSLPPRPVNGTPAQLDLTMFYNQTLANSSQEGNDAPNSLVNFPSGMNVFGGVPFDVRGVIQLIGGKAADGVIPKAVNGIPVRRKADHLHFLHFMGSIMSFVPYGVEEASFIVHYADGETVEIPLLFGVTGNNWWNIPEQVADPFEASEAVVVWTGRNPFADAELASLRIFKYTWENPRPEVTIDRLDFQSADLDRGPTLLGITVGE